MSNKHYFLNVNVWPYTGTFKNNHWMFTCIDGRTVHYDNLKGSGMRRVTLKKFHKAKFLWESN